MKSCESVKSCLIRDLDGCCYRNPSERGHGRSCWNGCIRKTNFLSGFGNSPLNLSLPIQNNHQKIGFWLVATLAPAMVPLPYTKLRITGRVK